MAFLCISKMTMWASDDAFWLSLKDCVKFFCDPCRWLVWLTSLTWAGRRPVLLLRALRHEILPTFFYSGSCSWSSAAPPGSNSLPRSSMMPRSWVSCYPKSFLTALTSTEQKSTLDTQDCSNMPLRTLLPTSVFWPKLSRIQVVPSVFMGLPSTSMEASFPQEVLCYLCLAPRPSSPFVRQFCKRDACHHLTGFLTVRLPHASSMDRQTDTPTPTHTHTSCLLNTESPLPTRDFKRLWLHLLGKVFSHLSFSVVQVSPSEVLTHPMELLGSPR